MELMRTRNYFIFVNLILVVMFSTTALSADKTKKINTDEYRKKYWTSGDDASYKVVQNRTYSKSGRIELGAFYGVTHTDPFLTVRQFGGSLAYHISEYIGIEGFYWIHQTSASSAQTKFNELVDFVTLSTNNPTSMMGGNIVWSPIYGKLSVLGEIIIYYDLHLLGGVGQVSTVEPHHQDGALKHKYIAPLIGIGNSIYLSNHLALSFSYRVTFYSETIAKSSTDLNQPGVTRSRVDPVVNFGVKFLF